MPDTPAGWGLLAAVVLFAAFLLLKSRIPLLPRDPAEREARRRIAEAKRRARRAGEDRAARVRAWLDAAAIALDDLDDPGLGASFAKRAVRADPTDVEALSMVIGALETAGRNRALERYLWRRLEGPTGPAYEAAFEKLLALYDGPLRHPERAAALRALRQRTVAADT